MTDLASSLVSPPKTIGANIMASIKQWVKDRIESGGLIDKSIKDHERK